MHPVLFWLAAALLWAGFTLWYGNWRGPLSPEEVEAYARRLAAGAAAPDPDRLATLRAFLAADDGREFFMVNLIRLHPEPVEVPGAGEREAANEVLARYSRPFLGGALRRATHPIFFAQAAARYLEQWGVEPDPGWTAAGVIRYRSRRDLAELAADPRFGEIHPFKQTALSHTLAFPATAGLALGPRVLVPLGLALAAALAHLQLGRGGG